jgi:hypothetical protein
MLIKIDFYLVSLRKYSLLINSSLLVNRAIESSAFYSNQGHNLKLSPQSGSMYNLVNAQTFIIISTERPKQKK